MHAPGEQDPKLAIRCIRDDNFKRNIGVYFNQKYKQHNILNSDIDKMSASEKMKFKQSLSWEQQNLWHLKHSMDDNYMTRPEVLADIYDTVGYDPYIDLCSSVSGSNSTCPFYYDALSDGRLQANKIKGKRVICNPPFYQAADYISTLETALKLDTDTKAILVVPDRNPQPWFRNLVESQDWHLVAVYYKGSKVFTKPKANDPVQVEERNELGGCVDDICIFELNCSPKDYRTINYDQLPPRSGNMIKVFGKLVTNIKQTNGLT